MLANLSGFDGSPESLRKMQLENGAEIARAVVNFQGPIYFVVVTIPADTGVHEVFINSATALATTDLGPTGTRESGNTESWWIGAWASAPTTYFMRGSAAHFAIFDSKLDAAAITRLFDAATLDGWTP